MNYAIYSVARILRLMIVLIIWSNIGTCKCMLHVNEVWKIMDKKSSF